MTHFNNFQDKSKTTSDYNSDFLNLIMKRNWFMQIIFLLEMTE